MNFNKHITESGQDFYWFARKFKKKKRITKEKII